MPSSDEPVLVLTATPAPTFERRNQLEEPDILTMRNLSLGPSCSTCESTCKCSAPKKRDSYPYFWKKTLGNPIQKRKKSGLLAPSQLKFIVVTDKPKRTEESHEVQNSAASQSNRATSPYSTSPTPTSSNKLFESRQLASIPNFSSLSLKDDSGQTKSKQPSSNTRRRPGTYKFARAETRMKMRIQLSLKDLCSVLPTIPEDGDEVAGSSGNVQKESFQNDDSSSSRSQTLMESMNDDITINELASYLDEFVYIPKKMSPMAEMMYT